MKGIKNFSIIVTTIFATSCVDKRPMSNDTFTGLISKLKVLESTFSYNLEEQNDENCYHTNTNEDSLFANFTVSIIGLLPDTIETYKMLYLYPGDDLYPTIRTFTKKGKLIDDQSICYNLCAGWDCTMDSCESTVKLKGANKIERYLRVVTSDCDSIGKKIIATSKTQTNRQIITIEKKGKIIFGNEQIN